MSTKNTNNNMIKVITAIGGSKKLHGRQGNIEANVDTFQLVINKNHKLYKNCPESNFTGSFQTR